MNVSIYGVKQLFLIPFILEVKVTEDTLIVKLFGIDQVNDVLVNAGFLVTGSLNCRLIEFLLSVIELHGYP